MTTRTDRIPVPHIRRFVGWTATIAAILAGLAGCGGGGDSGGAPPVLKAEGAYSGTTSRGYDIGVLVLEDDTVWAYYSVGSLIYGFVHGAGASANNAFSVSNIRDYYFPTVTTYSGSASGSYVPGVSVQGTLQYAGQTPMTFSATAAAVVGYNYDQPATPSAIAGAYSGTVGPTGETASVTIGASGALSAVTSSGCSFTGMAAPRASGKNVYDVAITFGPNPCLLANATVTGIGVITQPTSGVTQLLAAVVDPGRSVGLAFVGTR